MVRAEPFDIIEVNLSLYIGRAEIQGVSDQPVTARARFRSQISPSELCVAQSSTGTGSSPSISFFSCQFHSTNPHTHPHRQLLLPGRQMGEAWEPSKMQGSCEKREHWIGKYFHIFRSLCG